jgi:hypothetical protein
VLAGDRSYDHIGENDTFAVCKDTFGAYDKYQECAFSAAYETFTNTKARKSEQKFTLKALC